MHQLLFACVSISLKAAFNKPLSKKNHFGENFTVKCKMWDKIQFLSNKANFCVVLFFEANFLVLQSKLMKNVPTACLLTTPISCMHR